MVPDKTPDEMTAVVLDSYSGLDALRIERRPIPNPGPNEVLIKVAAAPINPSDLSFIEGLYGLKKPTPVIPGFEGSGTVVAVGKGVMGKYLSGKQVACVSHDQGDGVWAEYMVTSANLALPLGKSVSLEQGAMSVVNPLTAMSFLELSKEGKHGAIVQTAAASALGQMVNRLFRIEGIHVINIVRRSQQVELLKKQGAEIVINSNDSDFDQQLSAACQRYQANLAFDAVSGSLTSKVLDAMPKNSKVLVYGGLSYEPAQADPGQLIFSNKSIEGFWLTNWLGKKNLLQIMLMWKKAQRLIQTDLASNVRKQYPLQDVQIAIEEYKNQMTGGKILLKP